MNNSVLLDEASVIGVNLRSAERFQDAVQAELDCMGTYEFTLLLIKNYCLHQKHEILKTIFNRGLRVVCCETVTFLRMDAVRFAIIRAQGKNLPLNIREHAATLESLLDGSVEAVIVAGVDAVNKLSIIVGPDDPLEARKSNPESLRSLFGGNRLVENGLHCSVNQKEAHEELSLVFPNYIDVIKSKGLAIQVDQWLWSLWRSEPEGSLFSCRLFDIRFISRQKKDRRSDIRQLFKFVREKISGLVTSFTSKLPTASKAIHIESDSPLFKTSSPLESSPLDISGIAPENSATKTAKPLSISSSHECEATKSIRWGLQFVEPTRTEPTYLSFEKLQSQFLRRRIPDLSKQTVPVSQARKPGTSSHYDIPVTTPISNFETGSAVDMYRGKLTDESTSVSDEAFTSSLLQRLQSDSEAIFEDLEELNETDARL